MLFNHHSKKSHRFGFSVVELAIAVALLAILFTVALPAIQSMRESARNVTCQNRLAAIAQDSAVYEDLKCRLPVQIFSTGGVKWTEWTSSSFEEYWGYQQATSPLALIENMEANFRILPIMFDDTARLSGRFFFDIPGYDRIASQQLERFRCPSDSAGDNDQPTMGFLFSLVGINFNGPDDDFSGVLAQNQFTIEYGKSNFVGCMGATTAGELSGFGKVWNWRGMIGSREEITLEHVANADGLSNSIMFGENIGEVKTVGRKVELERSCMWFSGAIARGRGNVPFETDGGPEFPLLGHAKRSFLRGFGSQHRAGVNFVFGDGSVQQLARGIDWEAYYRLCGAFDTE